MEGLVMRKVRERLCLIVCGRGVRGMRRRGLKLSSVGLLLLQAIFVCVCVCLCVCVCVYERGGEMRRYEIQLRGHYFFFFF